MLIPGDVVQDKMVPNMPTEDSSPKNWIASERAFLVDVQSSARELKRKGVSMEDAGKQIAAAMKAKYPDWPSIGPIPNLVKRIYARSSARESNESRGAFAPGSH